MKITNEACIDDRRFSSSSGHILTSLRWAFTFRFILLHPIQIINTWLHRRKQRSHLMDLPDYLLDDIGLTRDQVTKEYNTPFWKEGIY